MNPMRSFTHRCQRSLPAGIQGALRRGILAWGVISAPARMLPAFIIVGAQRSGTTTLFRMLSDHPQVVRPTVSKGTAYFDLHAHRSLTWYRAHFPLRWSGWIRSRGRRRVTFESCGYYMFHPLAAERIARRLPRVRIVVLLRNPVDRAYSAHRHELARGFETLGFAEALQAEAARIEGAEERLTNDPDRREFDHQHHAYLARSRYVDQMQRLLETFGPDRVLALDAERLFAEPERQFAGLCDWLGLDRAPGVRAAKWNSEPRDPLPPEHRTQLDDYFKPYDAQLAELLGRPLAWRREDPRRG